MTDAACRRCGSRRAVEIVHVGFKGTGYHLHCTVCGLPGPVRATPEQAVEAWNERSRHAETR